MKKVVQLQTPLVPDAEDYVAAVARLEGFDAVILEENGGVSAITVAEMLKRRSDKKVLLKLNCRDRNRIALRSQLVTAASAGLLDVVLADGAHPIHTSFPSAKPVYELDCLNLLRMIKQGSPGFGDESVSALNSLEWTAGVCVGGSSLADVARAKKLAAAGADLFVACSLEAVAGLRLFWDKPIYLSVSEKQAGDVTEILGQAEAAGASGVVLIVESAEKVLDGSIAER